MLSSGRSHFDAVHVGETVYFVGGLCNDSHRNTLEIYCRSPTEQNQVENSLCSTQLSAPTQPRYDHCTAVLNGKIYFIGGKCCVVSRRVVSCCVVLCRVASCRVVSSCCVASCRVVSCCVVLCCVVSCRVVLCRVVLCCVVSRRVVLCCVVSCCVVSYCVVSCCVVSCRVASCRVVSRRVASRRVESCRVVSCCVVLCCAAVIYSYLYSYLLLSRLFPRSFCIKDSGMLRSFQQHLEQRRTFSGGTKWSMRCDSQQMHRCHRWVKSEETTKQLWDLWCEQEPMGIHCT